MHDLNRRDALRGATGAGMLAALAPQAPPELSKDEQRKLDRKSVLAAGLTEAEADCWEAVAQAAGKFFELPKLHVMDEHEVAHAIHIIQHKLLSRPAYRKYLELAKAQKR